MEVECIFFKTLIGICDHVGKCQQIPVHNYDYWIISQWCNTESVPLFHNVKVVKINFEQYNRPRYIKRLLGDSRNCLSRLYGIQLRNNWRAYGIIYIQTIPTNPSHQLLNKSNAKSKPANSKHCTPNSYE